MMNKILRGATVLAVLMWSGIFITGCPQSPQLEVAPATITFGVDQTERRLTLNNLGTTSFQWTLDTVVRESDQSPWTPAAVDWLTASKTSGTLAPGLENLTLSVQRTQLLPGSYTNTGVRVRAGATERIVPISLLVAPLLRAIPDVIPLAMNARSGRFELENRSQSALTWTVQYFEGNDPSVEAGNLPADMTVEPSGGVLPRQGSTLVSVNWSLTRGDFGLRISSPEAPGHDAVVLFQVARPITDLKIEPEVLTVYFSRPSPLTGVGIGTQPASKLTLRNVGRQTLNWSVTVQPKGDAIGQSPDVIQVEARNGVLPAGNTDSVTVRVAIPEEALAGGGNYELLFRLQGQDGVLVVPLVLEAVALPTVIASDPPNPDVLRPEYTLLRTLDFGRTEVQKEFWVVNIGPLESQLFFRIFHEDQDAAAPLILNVQPDSGDTNTRPGRVFYLPGTNDLVDARRVVVTIDRAAMQEDVEYREILIEAWNEDGTERIDAVAPWKVEARIERPPMQVEGAINRSRPPFLMRFVFLLRDTVGRAIPTRTPEDLARIRFEITEEGIPLDLNEVTLQVDGPETLKANIVLMLDYTGSMYFAGTNSPENPRAPGEVLDEIRAAAAMFLDDLPPSWRVALMYHNDRQPLNRLIHPFSTDRESLKTALRNFRVPPQLHGVSDVWDALIDAVDRIAAEDAPETLPFDDADIRSILFITDGNDNASTVDAGAALSAARDNRVRLYPLTYNVDSPISFADIITLASDSGGRLYNAGTAQNLVRLLGHRNSLVLTPVAQDLVNGDDSVSFKIVNAGSSPLDWTIYQEEYYPWIDSITPNSGVTLPGGESLITVAVAPEFLATPLLQGRALLHITSGDGEGQAVISLALEDDGVTIGRLAVDLFDTPGEIWSDLRNQIVLSYVTPAQQGGNYSIRAYYQPPEGNEISGFFEEDGVFFMGDVRAGQISLHTSGIDWNPAAATSEEIARAEVYVRADYVPRKVSSFKMRFMPMLDAAMPPEVAEAFQEHVMTVELAPEGLLVFPDGSKPDWRLVPGNDGIYTLLTSEQFSLPYAASGNLLRISFTNLRPFVEAAAAAGVEPEFFVDMRLDNSRYFEPATPYRPSGTVYFLYPSGPTNPNRPLRVGVDSDVAGPARTVLELSVPGINPEAPGVWDRDDDGIPDFNDPYPDNENLPGRLVQPASLLFQFPGSGVRTLSVRNNRWDTFEMRGLSIELPLFSSLTLDQFSWFVSDGGGGWTPAVPGDFTDLALAPGQELLLQLRFDPGALPASIYNANIRLQTDLFEDEVTRVEVRL